MRMELIFRFLLRTVHFVCNFYEFVRQKCASIVLAVEQLRHWGKIHNFPLLNSSNGLVSSLKIPRHLAVLLGHEDISILDLVQLISWCVIADVPYISFYDHRGTLQRNGGLLRKKLDELEPSIGSKIEWSTNVDGVIDNINTQIETKMARTNGINTNGIHRNTNDVVDKPSTRIQILSYSHGKNRIITLTKDLARIIDLNIIQDKDITEEFLDEKLTMNRKIPNPDMAILFGKTMCNYGFLPWQSRITEFFLLPTHHNLSISSFKETLIKFSKCEQRHGK